MNTGRAWPRFGVWGILGFLLVAGGSEAAAQVAVEELPPMYKRQLVFDFGEVELTQLSERVQEQIRAGIYGWHRPWGLDGVRVQAPARATFVELMADLARQSGATIERLNRFERPSNRTHGIDRYGYTVAGPFVVVLSYVEPFDPENPPYGIQWRGSWRDFQKHGHLLVRFLARSEDVDERDDFLWAPAISSLTIQLKDGTERKPVAKAGVADQAATWFIQMSKQEWEEVSAVRGRAHAFIASRHFVIASSLPVQERHTDAATGLEIDFPAEADGDANAQTGNTAVCVRVKHDHGLSPQEMIRMQKVDQEAEAGLRYKADPYAYLEEDDAAFFREALPRLRRLVLIREELVNAAGERVWRGSSSAARPGEVTVSLDTGAGDEPKRFELHLAERVYREVPFEVEVVAK